MGKKRHPGKGPSWVRLLFFGMAIFASVVVLKNYAAKLKAPCANSLSCIKDLSGRYEQAQIGVFEGQKVPIPHLQARNILDSVLGETDGANKHIYINLAKQELSAFEGDKLVYVFPVSTGKWGATPTGDFRIWSKLRFTRMAGGNPAIGTYYNLPNVPYTMYFYSDEIPQTRGYALHGAYWHNNFGHTMSHGCVNLRTVDAEKLYYWTTPYPVSDTSYPTKDSPGTLITIYGVSSTE